MCRKLAGQPAVEYPDENRQPCVGMCFRNRSTGVKMEERRNKRGQRTRCVGLCYLAKLKKEQSLSPDGQKEMAGDEEGSHEKNDDEAR